MKDLPAALSGWLKQCLANVLTVLLSIPFSSALTLLSLSAKVISQGCSHLGCRTGALTTLAWCWLQLHTLHSYVHSGVYKGLLGPGHLSSDGNFGLSAVIPPPILQSCQGWMSIDWAPQMP